MDESSKAQIQLQPAYGGASAPYLLWDLYLVRWDVYMERQVQDLPGLFGYVHVKSNVKYVGTSIRHHRKAACLWKQTWISVISESLSWLLKLLVRLGHWAIDEGEQSTKIRLSIPLALVLGQRMKREREPLSSRSTFTPTPVPRWKWEFVRSKNISYQLSYLYNENECYKLI